MSDIYTRDVKITRRVTIIYDTIDSLTSQLKDVLNLTNDDCHIRLIGDMTAHLEMIDIRVTELNDTLELKLEDD